MSCQFFVSPGIIKCKKEPIEASHEDAVSILSFAPFTPNVKISFDNVLVGTERIHRISVVNPTSRVLKVSAKNIPSLEFGVSLSWVQHDVPPNSDVLLDIYWRPTAEIGGIRHVLVFEDNRKMKREVALTFKSVLPKKKNRSKTNQVKPVVLSKKLKDSPKSRVLSKLHQLSNTAKMPPSRSSSIVRKQEKENVNPIPTFKSSSTVSFSISPGKTEFGRGTYTINELRCKKNSSFNNVSQDSLEIIQSPLCSLKSKLNSEFFTFTSLQPTQQNISPSPIRCSTPNNLKQFNTDTYIQDNINSDTYVKGNISTDTYVKGNLSTETYLVEKFKSTDTYAVSPNHLELSPYLLIPIEATSICKKFLADDSMGLKRKLAWSSDEPIYVSPPKRARFLTTANHTKLNVLPENAITYSYVNPFLTKNKCHSTVWMGEQEENFKKWFNAILTPPVELDSEDDGSVIDVAKLWNQCKYRNIPEAVSKETVSCRYHTNTRLDSLRKSARILFKSNEITQVLDKVSNTIENNKLAIRADKNLHLDVNLQSAIMSLLLSYNPLWLRIGLETIYEVVIDLNSNTDFVGLSSFVMQNMFHNSQFLKKFKRVHSPKYAAEIKKHSLKKFLSLIYFLDVAKSQKLIAHDPCLFCRKAIIKESREILLKFSTEILSAAVGDITRFLRFTGYILTHKQKPIHEFDYRIKVLIDDLRDGIRLTRAMEIILMKYDLTEKLRVPAISRLQKIYNVKLVFDSLREANFEILKEITPQDIVDGHAEKILSFLWQIIYKFQAPILTKAAYTIQAWWKSLRVVLRRRIQHRKRFTRQTVAAQTIQVWYRRLIFIRKIQYYAKVLKKQLVEAKYLYYVIRIQAQVRMKLAVIKYGTTRNLIRSLQSHCRGYLVRKALRHKLYCIVKIQSYFRTIIAQKKFLTIRVAAITIQKYFRANRLMRASLANYRRKKQAIRTVQTWIRSLWLMRKERSYFCILKQSTVYVQKHYRLKLLVRQESQNFSHLKQAAILLQRRFRANKIMREQRLEFVLKKKSAFCIQAWFRSLLMMRYAKEKFLALKKWCLFVQRRFRANRLAKQKKLSYVDLKRVTVFIQKYYRAKLCTRRIRLSYLHQKHSTIIIQTWYRSILIMRKERQTFLTLRQHCLFTQRLFRANILKKRQRTQYETLKHITINIQRVYRAKVLGHHERLKYLYQKKSAVAIQTWFRSIMLMKKEKKRFLSLKKAAFFVQERFRANSLSKQQRTNFIALKQTAVFVQRKYKAKVLGLKERNNYLFQKQAIVVIQKSFRCFKLMKTERQYFVSLKQATILAQRRFRENRLAKQHRKYYLDLKRIAISVQQIFRANILARQERCLYLHQRQAAIVIQTWFRSKKIAMLDKGAYNVLKQATLKIQQWYRSIRRMRFERRQFLALKQAVRVVETKYKVRMYAKAERRHFLMLRASALFVQRHFRSIYRRKLERNRFLLLRRVTIWVQRKFRSNREVRKDRASFLKIKGAVFVLQKFYRDRIGNVDRRRFLRYKETRFKAAVLIQSLWKGYVIRKKYKEISKVRNKLKVVNSQMNPKNTLGHRRERAEDLLRNDNYSLDQLIYALEELEYITRRCKKACREVSVEFAEQMYNLTICSNRSLPEMKVSIIATRILINCCKFSETTSLIWFPEYIENIFNVMLHCCDKENDLFPCLSTLLWLLAHNSVYKVQIISVPNFDQHINKIKNNCLRKQKMVSCSKSVRKHSLFVKCVKNICPSLIPDWGIERMAGPSQYVFTNSVHACLSLIDILS